MAHMVPVDENKDDYVVPNESIGKIILDNIKSAPSQNVALIDAVTEESLTYSDILKTSIKLADSLQKHGIRQKDVIAIVTENNLHYYPTVLSSLLVGAVINLASPSWTENELKRAFNISNPKLIFCSKDSRQTLLNIKQQLTCLKTIIVFDSQSSDESFQDFVNKGRFTTNFKPVTFDVTQQSAVIFYSSGTTGLPKGVELTHKNLHGVLLYLGSKNYGNVSSNDVAICNIPLYHMFGFIILLGGLAFSMKTIVMSKFKPDTYLKSIEKYKVTKLYIIPTIGVFLAKYPALVNYDISSVKHIVNASAALKQNIQDLITERMPLAKIRQIYGSTEGGICVAQPLSFCKPKSVGILFKPVTYKICNPTTKKILGPEEPGEICFKGYSIMKRYIGNPEATQAAIDSEGFYHTGDIGYCDQDGYFFLTDRITDIIKYKGFQVSPSELEGILITHSAVKDCAVIAIPDERVGELPVAFVVKQDSVETTTEELKNFVSDQVSAEKRLHGGIIFIEQIPRNTGGKILRRDLQKGVIDGHYILKHKIG